MPAGPAERSTVVGYVSAESRAYEQGLRIGDEILTVNGTGVEKWSDFMMEAALQNEVSLVLERPGEGELTIEVPTEKGQFGEQTVAGVESRNICMVLSVDPGMSAAKAGIKNGDVIVEFDGEEVLSRAHLINLVNQAKDRRVPTVVKRAIEGRTVSLSLFVTPELDGVVGRARIGIMFNMAAVEHDTRIRPLPSVQLKHHASAIFRFLRALMNPRQAKAASRAVGGPVAIMFSYWVIVKTSMMLAVWFTGLLNVNLAIINLLPIPVLDGGHIVFALWELLTGRAASARVVNFLTNVFAVLLICLFVFLSVRDLDRFTQLGRRVRDIATRLTDKGETNSVPDGSFEGMLIPESAPAEE